MPFAPLLTNGASLFTLPLRCGNWIPFLSNAAFLDPRVLTALATPTRARRDKTFIAISFTQLQTIYVCMYVYMYIRIDQASDHTLTPTEG